MLWGGATEGGHTCESVIQNTKRHAQEVVCEQMLPTSNQCWFS